ncbi:MAG: M48 family metallopeptidase [Bacteroidia bacterium]
MKIKLIAYAALFIMVAGCSSVPITNRKQMNLLPESEVRSMAVSEYRSFLSQSKVVNNTENSRELKSVGEKISRGAEKYLSENKMGDRVKNYSWEFNLIDDPTVNAWAMPGGKVVFYAGILPVCQDENGIAVVMGHEIAHAVARHGNERMSQALAAQLGGMALDVALSDKPEQTRQLFLSAYGVGANVAVLLPYSRLHESEADKLGLVFMAVAGYDPREAPAFWKRMQAQSGGGSPPEFLSTHPGDERRIKDLNDYMPKALKHYAPAQQ